MSKQAHGAPKVLTDTHFEHKIRTFVQKIKNINFQDFGGSVRMDNPTDVKNRFTWV